MPSPDVKPTAAAHLQAVRQRLLGPATKAVSPGPGIFVRQYRHSAGQTPAWQLLRQRQVPAAGRAGLLRLTQLTLAAQGRAQQVIKVEVYETSGPEAAYELLVELLTAFQALPETLELGDEVGEVVIAMPGDMARLFARGNLVVTLASVGAERVAVGDAARSVDQFLTAPPRGMVAQPAAESANKAAGKSAAKGKRRPAAEPAAAEAVADADADAMVRYVASAGPIRLQDDGTLKAEAGAMPAAQVLDERADGWVALAGPAAEGKG